MNTAMPTRQELISAIKSGNANLQINLSANGWTLEFKAGNTDIRFERWR
jgi:hypothetical protein